MFRPTAHAGVQSDGARFTAYDVEKHKARTQNEIIVPGAAGVLFDFVLGSFNVLSSFRRFPLPLAIL